MTRVCQLVVVLYRIATTVQTREKEFLYIILLPAAVFYQVGRDSCPHIARTSTQRAVLLFAPRISLIFKISLFCQVLWCGSIHETPCTGGNSLSMEEKIKNDILSCHCWALTWVLRKENMTFWYARIQFFVTCIISAFMFMFWSVSREINWFERVPQFI